MLDGSVQDALRRIDRLALWLDLDGVPIFFAPDELVILEAW